MLQKIPSFITIHFEKASLISIGLVFAVIPSMFYRSLFNGTLWAYTFLTKIPEFIIEAFQFGVNVIVYAVTHGKISDYSGYKK